MSTIFWNFHLYSFSQLIFNIIQINVFSFSWSSQLTIVSRRDFFLSSCVQPISWSASSSISSLLPYPLLSQWLPTSYTQLQYNEKYSPPFFKLFKGTVLQDFVSLVYLTNMALLFICWSNFWHLVSISQSYSCAKNPTVSLYAAESKAPQCHVDTKESDSAWWMTPWGQTCCIYLSKVSFSNLKRQFQETLFSSSWLYITPTRPPRWWRYVY